MAPGEGRASPAATWTQVLSKAEGGPGGASSRWGQLSGARSGKRPQPVAEGPGQLRKAESVLQYHLPWASGTGVQSCLCLLQVHPVPTLSPAAPFHPSHILMGGPLRVWVLLLCTSDLPLLPASHLAWRSQSLAWPPSPVTADLRGCPSRLMPESEPARHLGQLAVSSAVPSGLRALCRRGCWWWWSYSPGVIARHECAATG